MPNREARLGVGRRGSSGAACSSAENAPPAPHVKLSVRLSRLASHRLDLDARAAGLSRGAYLTRMIDAAPAVLTSAERMAAFNGLNASASELAVFSRDINHLTLLLRSGSAAAAREYHQRLETLDRDVRAHLQRNAEVIAMLTADRKGRARWSQIRSTHPGSQP